jgi:hypothetical protein
LKTLSPYNFPFSPLLVNQIVYPTSTQVLHDVSFPIVKNTRVTGLPARAHIDPSWAFTRFYHIQHKDQTTPEGGKMAPTQIQLQRVSPKPQEKGTHPNPNP